MAPVGAGSGVPSIYAMRISGEGGIYSSNTGGSLSEWMERTSRASAAGPNTPGSGEGASDQVAAQMASILGQLGTQNASDLARVLCEHLNIS